MNKYVMLVLTNYLTIDLEIQSARLYRHNIGHIDKSPLLNEKGPSKCGICEYNAHNNCRGYICTIWMSFKTKTI